MVLLDIAKAYPSTPHALPWETMYTLGVPASMVSLLRQAYGQTRCFFRAGGRQHAYFQQQGVKEGCPLSPLLFCVVYEIFHRALNKEFPKVKFFVYMDDVAFIAPDSKTTHLVLHRVIELGRILGFRVNMSKTEIYRWTPRHVTESFVWGGVSNKVRPPILQCSGHILARPQWAHKARADYVALVQSDLAQYASVPMNGWERAQLVNFVLMPHWMHRLLLFPSDKMFHRIDTMVSEFVRQPKGMETSRNHHLMGTPVRDGGLGLRYIYRAYRRRFITSMQHTLRAHPDLFPFPSDKGVPRIQTPLLAYVSLLQSLGAIPGISLQPMKQRPCGPDLFDSEDTEDSPLLAAQQPRVGQPDIAIKYCSPFPVWHIQEHGDTPTGFKRTEVCGYEVYTNEKPPVGNSWHSDGSKLLVTPDCQGSPQGSRAGIALTCGPFQCIARVHGPRHHSALD